MNVEAWKRKNQLHKLKERLKHPWPLYQDGGGIYATVIRANGEKENLGKVATNWTKRWKTGTGTGQG